MSTALRIHTAAPRVEPLVVLDAGAPTPLYRQLYDALRQAIVDGRLRAGVQLPASRALAAGLQLSRNTVAEAYDRLHAEGYLVRHARRGTFVARTTPDAVLRAQPASHRSHPSHPSHPSQPHLVPDDGRGGPRPAVRPLSTRGAAIAAMALPAGVDAASAPRAFRPGVPALDAFPVATWSRLALAHWRGVTRRDLAYGRSEGYAPLRAAIAEHLVAARGVRCTAEQVMIVGGSQQGLAIAARLLLDPGDTVWMEEPGYVGARAALAAAQARIVPVPVDDDGIDVGAGEWLAPDARLAVVTPSHQHPLGMVMSMARRQALLAWARRADAWIVEDDYDGEIRYHGRPLPAVQGLDGDARVLHVGTFSKTLFPALRLGYVVLPPRLVEPFARARLVDDRHSSVADQAALAAFIAEGHYARHVRRMRALYADRQAALLDALAPWAHVLEARPVDAGLDLLAWLPAGVDDRIAARAAAEAGIETRPLSPFAQRPLARGALILNFAGCDERALREGAEALVRVMKGLGIGGQGLG